MIKFNGNINFKQYFPLKPVKYGIKIFLLCDCVNYYCFKFKFFSGNELNNNNEYHSIKNLVEYLMEGNLNQYKTVYMDNYYTNLEVANFLNENKTGLIGTMRLNWIKNKNNFILPKEIGNYSFYINNKKDLFLISYYDTKVVFLLTNVKLPKIDLL